MVNYGKSMVNYDNSLSWNKGLILYLPSGKTNIKMEGITIFNIIFNG